jgi:hypothetical protein
LLTDNNRAQDRENVTGVISRNKDRFGLNGAGVAPAFVQKLRRGTPELPLLREDATAGKLRAPAHPSPFLRNSAETRGGPEKRTPPCGLVLRSGLLRRSYLRLRRPGKAVS